MAAEGGPPQVGDKVRVDGMKKRLDLNGRVGVVTECCGGTSAGRWLVLVEAEKSGEDEAVKILEKNLTVLQREGSDDDEAEEFEEFEEAEDTDEDGTDDNTDAVSEDQEAEMEVEREDLNERLGLNFASPTDLTLVSITPGVLEGCNPENLLKWKLVKINGTPVTTMQEAASILESKLKLSLTFQRKASKWISVLPPTASSCAAEAEEAGTPAKRRKKAASCVSFTIPPFAPLNPGAKIDICCDSTGSVFYRVNGEPRPPFHRVSFSLTGDHYTRELQFPDLGTCMWLPADGFLATYSALYHLLKTCGAVATRGFARRFKQEHFDKVAEMEVAHGEAVASKTQARAAKQLKKGSRDRKALQQKLRQVMKKKKG